MKYRKGHKPWNFGLKGNKPWNFGLKGIHLSPGSEFTSGEHHTGCNHPSWKGGLQHPVRDCKHLWTGTNTRSRRPRVVYEKYHGKIPDGYVVRHLDGDCCNDDPANLVLVSRAENLRLNLSHNRKGGL